MSSVGKLTADLIARTKKFEAGMDRGKKKIRGTGQQAKRTRGHVRGLGKSFQGLANRAKMLSGTLLALAGVGGFTSLAKSAIEFGSSQSDIAGQLKINTVAFQVYSGAIRDAGGDQEQMKKSILSQTQAIVQGSEGLTTFTRAFDRLGLNVNDLRNQKPEEAFERIAKAVANAKDQQGALTAVSEIYGKRNAPELIEVMERLTRDGFGKMADEIRRTYGIMDAETQARLDKAADRIEQFKQRATIKVGDIIAGEADFAVIKELGFRLMAAAGKFGGSLLDRISALGNVISSGLAASFLYVADRFGNALQNVVDKLRLGLGEAMLKISENNPVVDLDRFAEMADKQRALQKEIAKKQNERDKKGTKTWGDFFNATLKDQTDFAGEFSGYWSNLADKQRGILNEARSLAADEEKARKDRLSLIREASTPKRPTSSINQPAGQSGIVAAAKASAAQSGIQTGRIQTGRIGDAMAAMPSFDQRMREGGLFLANNDPYSGRGAPGLKSASAKKTPTNNNTPMGRTEQLLEQINSELKGEGATA